MSSESLNSPIPPSTGENITQKSLLIFDLDGTLIDSVPDLADAVNAMLTALGKANFSEDVIRNWVGNGGKVLVQRALSLSLIHISEPTRQCCTSRMPSSA